MHGNIIEIGTDNKKLSVYAGFLRISENNKIIKEIPLDLLLSIIVTSSDVIYTQPLLQRMSEEGIPLIICGKNYIPSGIFLPLIGNYKQSHIQRVQFATKLTLQKRLWQQIVMEKVKQQAAVLKMFGKCDSISPLLQQITSGDSKNIEAIAAKKYFSALFGKSFKRDTNVAGINSFLNYGYAIIRACTARFVIGSGLCPSLAIKHQNKLNPLCLVDDLMEPFRPLVDAQVYTMFQNDDLSNQSELTSVNKRQLSALLDTNFQTQNNISPVYLIIENFVRSYVTSLMEQKVILSSDYTFKNVQ